MLQCTKTFYIIVCFQLCGNSLRKNHIRVGFSGVHKLMAIKSRSVCRCDLLSPKGSKEQPENHQMLFIWVVDSFGWWIHSSLVYHERISNKLAVSCDSLLHDKIFFFLRFSLSLCTYSDKWPTIYPVISGV